MSHLVQELPLRPKNPDHASVTVHRIPAEDGVIAKVTPPKEPAPGTLKGKGGGHVPCDIVLVIDVSGSMGQDAPVPGETEHNGLCVLDLVKHAARTILETLGGDDRLAIVTFETAVHVLQELIPMTEENKKTTENNIASMEPLSATNLWQGMLKGIELFQGETHTGRVPAIMVLTDGMPNFMSPPQGYIPKMRTLKNLSVPIHTFGFGYLVRSGLLKSISEFTGGHYAFIPDAGMIGTVFVHAVANMQATFATEAVVTFTYPRWMRLEQTTGIEVGGEEAKNVVLPGGAEVCELTVRLGSLQYGQSRGIYLQYAAGAAPPSHALAPTALDASLVYHTMGPESSTYKNSCTIGDTDYEILGEDDKGEDNTESSSAFSSLPAAEITFYKSRAAFLRLISSMFPLKPDQEREAVDVTDLHRAALKKQADDLIKAAEDGKSNASSDALLADITGQVTMALSNTDYYRQWGVHYLPSLHSAHAAQQCNSFKDAGPLQYGTDSPLFIACRDALDTAFDTLPPPTPTISSVQQPPVCVSTTRRSRARSARSVGGGAIRASMTSPLRKGYSLLTSLASPSGGGAAPSLSGGAAPSSSPPPITSMRRYRMHSAPCFASFCRVTLADGRRVRVNRLRRGMRVLTPKGPRAVVAILKTPVSGAPMVSVGRLLITPWHPISADGLRWEFPCQTRAARAQPSIRYTGAIYSVLLQPDKNPDAHAMSIEGSWVVTFGHGLIKKEDADVADDVRVHKFFGDYLAVCRSLANMGARKDGIVVNSRSSRPSRINMRLRSPRK